MPRKWRMRYLKKPALILPARRGKPGFAPTGLSWCLMASPSYIGNHMMPDISAMISIMPTIMSKMTIINYCHRSIKAIFCRSIISTPISILRKPRHAIPMRHWLKIWRSSGLGVRQLMPQSYKFWSTANMFILTVKD